MTIAKVTHVEKPASRVSAAVVGTVISLVLFGLHVRYSLPLGQNFLIPYAICTIALSVATLVFPIPIPRAPAKYFAWLVGLAFVSIFLAPDPIGHLVDRVRGFLFFSYTLVFALIFLAYVVQASRRQLETICFVAAAVLLVGAFLELTFPPVKAFSDAVRHLMRPDIAEYALGKAIRDIMQMGGARPNFLASESAVLGLTISLLLTTWFLLFPGVQRGIVTFFLAAFGFAVVRSPSLLLTPFAIFSAALLLPVYYWGKGTEGRSRSLPIIFNPKVLIAIGAGIALFFLVLYLSNDVRAAFLQRGQEIMSGRDISTLLRTVIPAAGVFETLKSYPLFGAGIGGRYFAAQMLVQAMAEFSHINVNNYFLDPMHSIRSLAFANAALQVPLFFGIAGSAYFFYVVHRFVKNYAPGATLYLLVVIGVFGNEETTLSGLYIWAALVLFTVALCKSQRDRLAVQGDERATMHEREVGQPFAA